MPEFPESRGSEFPELTLKKLKESVMILFLLDHRAQFVHAFAFLRAHRSDGMSDELIALMRQRRYFHRATSPRCKVP